MRDREEPVDVYDLPRKQIPDKADGQLTLEGIKLA